jgi:8-oxo-dGTP pyrophosphatase MutT (NUDIX family)
VPYEERLRWFRALRAWIEPEPREAVRAVVVDRERRVLLVRFRNAVTGAEWWATPGGGVEPGESDEAALRRELREELGLAEFDLGPLVHTYEHTFPWQRRLLRQRSRFHVVHVDAHEPAPQIDLAAEGVAELRWWSVEELERLPVDAVSPPELARLVRTLTA